MMVRWSGESQSELDSVGRETCLVFLTGLLKEACVVSPDLAAFSPLPQGHSPKVLVKKKVQRCGVWQIKPMTSLDQDPLSTKSNNSGFGGYSQMKIYKGCKNS